MQYRLARVADRNLRTAAMTPGADLSHETQLGSWACGRSTVAGGWVFGASARAELLDDALFAVRCWRRSFPNLESKAEQVDLTGSLGGAALCHKRVRGAGIA
eukprot:5434605-Amphidinium_carterae.1